MAPSCTGLSEHEIFQQYYKLIVETYRYDIDNTLLA